MKQNKHVHPQKIGLTGGIGAGKSTVSNRLRMLGAHIIDADAISRNALSTHGPCYDAVIALFGTQIIREDDSIDRAMVADLIFSDETKRLALNDIVHPYVLGTMHQECNEIIAANPDALVIFDIPLLIECGAYQDMDCNLVVTTPDEIRVERICKRNHTTKEEAWARIQSQIPQEEQCLYADYIIDNGGTLEELYQRVDEIYAELCGGKT